MTKYFATAIICVLILPALAFAIGDDFQVQQQIGTDSTPPTVPAGVTTTPVTATQINISWGTSTDTGVGVSGYQLFRDNVQIATTTAVSYSDTGLTPSTTYAYNVTAFDLFLNISARSATSSTTTLPLPATTTPTTTISSGGGSSDTSLIPIVLEISEVEVAVEDVLAVIQFTTSGFAIASVKYGTTPQYETGSLASGIYKKAHSFNLTELEPNVQYFFEVVATNQRGDTVVYQADFVTKALSDIIPPTNVSDFQATINGNDVDLSWQNPGDDDFANVRIIANERFYPTDIADGMLLYEGSRESYVHKAVSPHYQRMYYTIFAFDENGNQSSGAIAQVMWPQEGGDVTLVIEPDVPPIQVDPELSLSFTDLEFVQNARVRQGMQSFISLDPNRQFTIRIPYDRTPEHLKTITVTLTDPDNPTHTFAFLLRVNERKTHYEATIGALKRQAEFPLRFALLDFKTKEITSFSGVISTVPDTAQTYPDVVPTPVEQAIFVFSRWWWWLIILILLLLAYWLMKD